MARTEELDPDISECLRDLGYVPGSLLTNPDVVEWLREGAEVLIDLAESFEVGTVLERRDDFLNARRTCASISS